MVSNQTVKDSNYIVRNKKNDDDDYFISFAVENSDRQLKLSRENGKTIGQRIAYGLGDTCEDAANKAKNKIESVLDMSLSKLLDEHETAWKELLHTGIHLDPVDPGTFNDLVELASYFFF